MPEYLAPGVYVEEVPARAHPIPGVSTSEGCLERTHYFSGQMLTAADLARDQSYAREKLRRHNRMLHGYGVVCGLGVTVAPTGAQPWRVRIAAGLALGPDGEEICLPAAVALDLAAHRPGKTSRIVIAARYVEVPWPDTPPSGDEAPLHDRIRDGLAIGCLAALPPSHARVGAGACPSDPWVVLAEVRLPHSRRARLTRLAVDARCVRRVERAGVPPAAVTRGRAGSPRREER